MSNLPWPDYIPRAGPPSEHAHYASFIAVWQQYWVRSRVDPLTPKPTYHISRGYEIHEPIRLPDTIEARESRALGPLAIADMTTKGAASRPPSREALRQAGERAVAAVRRRKDAANRQQRED